MAAAAIVIDSVGSFDAVRTIPRRLRALNMPQSFFAKWTNVSTAELSRLLNGDKAMSGYQAEKFYQALDELENLVNLMYPARLEWDLPSVKILVEQLLRNPVAKKDFERSWAVMRGALENGK